MRGLDTVCHLCGKITFPSYSDDFFSICTGYASNGIGKWSGLGKPSGNWYGGILRDDICYRVWYYSRAVLLCDGI